MFVECKVIGKQRPRFKHIGGYVTTYTPKETKNLEELISNSYKGECYASAVKVEIKAIFEPPKSLSNKRRLELVERGQHTKKPDIDNVAKLVLDALNGVAYQDDKQVVELVCIKEYGEKEGLDIQIYERQGIHQN